MKLLVLDNYDSFTYNLVHLIEKISPISFDVIRNDKITLDAINQYDKILLSPGPGLPKDAGIMSQLLKTFSEHKDILGICLGLQAIGENYGATLKNLTSVCHGQSTPINIIQNDYLFDNCPSTFLVGRYHSWVINPKELNNNLQVTATDEAGNIMAIKHLHHKVRGVQFHPESVLSEFGETIINYWLNN
ncbi:MAG: aminodeoxychorismate/anthranilate synthase component II [Bacteroidia bacterium]|nr:aminodeoxychorismate/anthranilate synthase component II [Bacteroidia bacterium]